jgi:competence protein ComEC
MFAMLKSAKQAGVRCVPVDNHDRARFGEQLQMLSFCKGGGAGEGSGYSGLSGSSSSGGENEKCIVCLLRYGEFEVMFTGDADEELEQEICDENGGSINKAIEADVLKVGHHGSRTSNSKTFLKQVDPKVSVISVGEHNKYGHPSSDAITRIRAVQSKIYRTDRDGDVTIMSDGNAFRVNTEH